MSPLTKGLSISYDPDSDDDEPLNSDAHLINKTAATNSQKYLPQGNMKASANKTKKIVGNNTRVGRADDSSAKKKDSKRGRPANRPVLKDISNGPEQDESDEMDVSQSIGDSAPALVKSEPSEDAAKQKARGRNSKKNANTTNEVISMEIDKGDRPEAKARHHHQHETNRKGSEQAELFPSHSPQQYEERKEKDGTSETEKGTNASLLRRRLEEMTRKFADMEMRYQTLQDVGLVEAQSNFDKVKITSEKRATAAKNLIASLRSELVAQKTTVADLSSLRDDNTRLTSDLEQLKVDKSSLESSLTEAQNEIKTLHARLSATRSTSVTSDAAHGRGPNGSANGSESLKRALKEDLYSDLTGLLIRDVKRREEDARDVFDCIQIGRNGTLHFHLAVSNPTTNGKVHPQTPGGSLFSFDKADFEYTPLLDPTNDRELIAILPDFLSEDIGFTREQAGGFYARITDCLTRKSTPAHEDGDDKQEQNVHL